MSSASVIKLTRQVSGLRSGENGMEDDAAVNEQADSSAAVAAQEHIAKVRTEELDMLHSRIHSLEDELHAAREQGYNLGFQDGLAAEQKKLKQDLETHAQQIRDLAQRLEKEFDRALANMEEPLLRMSFRISEKILKASLPEDVRNESLVATIQSFLREVLHEGGVVVHVSPQSLAFMLSEETSDKLKQSFPGRIRFVADDSLGSGECRVETPEHIMDGRYANQLAILESKLS